MRRRSGTGCVVIVLAQIGCLQDAALLVLGAATARKQGSTSGVLENLVDTLVGFGRAFEVLVSTNLLADLLTLFGADGLLARLSQLVCDLLVVTEILLAANENNRKALAEVKDLGDPLLLDVVKGIGGVDGEANQNNVRIRVRQRTKTVVILLTSSIPKG